MSRASKRLLGLGLIGVLLSIFAAVCFSANSPSYKKGEESMNVIAQKGLIYPDQEPISGLTLPPELEVYTGNTNLTDVLIYEEVAYALDRGGINFAKQLSTSGLKGVKKELYFGSQTFVCGNKSIRKVEESIYYGSAEIDAESVLMSLLIGIKSDRSGTVFDGFETRVVSKAFTVFSPFQIKDGKSTCDGTQITMLFPYKHLLLSFDMSVTSNLAKAESRDIDSDTLQLMLAWINAMIEKVDQVQQ